MTRSICSLQGIPVTRIYVTHVLPAEKFVPKSLNSKQVGIPKIEGSRARFTPL